MPALVWYSINSMKRQTLSYFYNKLVRAWLLTGHQSVIRVLYLFRHINVKQDYLHDTVYFMSGICMNCYKNIHISECEISFIEVQQETLTWHPIAQSTNRITRLFLN